MVAIVAETRWWENSQLNHKHWSEFCWLFKYYGSDKSFYRRTSAAHTNNSSYEWRTRKDAN